MGSKSAYILSAFLAVMLFAIPVRATHIVGGEISYRCLGGNNYEIRVRVYRDCYTGVPDMPDPLRVDIYDANGTKVQTISIPFPGKQQLTPMAPTACTVLPTDVCVEVAEYLGVVNLPPIPGGYQLGYNICCRNPTITNGPANQAAQYYNFIPDISNATCNSSPVIQEWPPVFICANSPLVYNHVAVDPDGDSITYELCTPLQNGSSPPFNPVTFISPYSAGNPLGGNPPLAINPVTGVLTGTPDKLGQYVVGVCVNEYRNGKLISRTTRDFQFNVVDCTGLTVASGLSATVDCNTFTVQFYNSSTGGISYYWSFGDGNTSNAFEPTYTYPGTGTYNVMLIAYSSNPQCNDTVTDLVTVVDTCRPCGMILSTTKNNASCQAGGCARWTCTVPCTSCSTVQMQCGGSVTTGCSGSSSIGGSNTACSSSCGCTSVTCNGVDIFSVGAANCTYTLTSDCQGGTSSNGNGTNVTLNFSGYIGQILGDATVSVSGSGNPPYSYQWTTNPVQTGAMATGLSPGTYTVIVTDINGCTEITQVTIDGDSNIDLSNNTKTDVSACGQCNGSASVTPTGGVTPYTYIWTPGGQTTSSITGLCKGNYTVEVRDANNCPKSVNFTIIEPTNISATISTTGVLCLGDATGTGTVTPSGGNPGYTYLWNTNPPQTTQTATGLPKGFYTVTVTDQNGCKAVVSTTVNGPQPLDLTTSFVKPLCAGQNNGSATVSVTGGAGGYLYTWSPSGKTTATATGLSAGTYTVTIRDANNCQTDTVITITQPFPIWLDLDDQSSLDCAGNFTGSIKTLVTGGTPGAINTGTVYTEDFSGYTNGTTIGSGSPAKWTSSTTGCTISAGDWFQVNNGRFEGYDIDCNAAPNNAIWTSQTIDISGCSCVKISGTFGYGGTMSASEFIQGFYSLNGGGQVQWVNHTDDNATGWPNGNPSNDTSACLTGTTLQVFVKMQNTGGTDLHWFDNIKATCYNQFTYQWCNGETTNLATALPTGNCGVTVTDGNGCVADTSITITAPPPLSILIGGTDVCPGGNNGTANAGPIGGQPVYTFLWCNGVTTQSVSNLAAGPCTVTVTDGNGCTETASVTIGTAPPMALDTITDCVNGAIDLGVSGGSAPYVYNWDNGVTTQDQSGLNVGDYRVIVWDGNNCIDSITAKVYECLLCDLLVTSGTTDVSCFGGSNGTATVTPASSYPPFTYVWDDGNSQSTATATGLIAGTYNVTVTDSIACDTTFAVTITQPPDIVITPTPTPVLCNGGSTGSVNITVTGGTGAYGYSWSNGRTTQSITGLTAGNYCVTVTDANLCVKSVCVIVTEPPALTSSVINTPVSCNGGSDGTATVTAGGGTGGYGFLWTGGQTNATATGLPAGIHCVTVTDGNGCTDTACTTITEPTALSLVMTRTNATCNGLCNGTATVTPSGGTATYTYLWSTTPAQTGQTASGLCAGTHTVTVTDANGCTDTSQATITEPPALTLTTAQTDPLCNGSCDGTASVTGSGGTLPYTYSWSNNETTPGASGLCAGTHTVTVTDFNSCAATAVVTLTDPPLLTGTTTSTPASCPGTCDGTGTVTPAGGTPGPGYTFVWSTVPGQTGATATGLCTGTHTVTVSDANNCTSTVSVTVTEPPAILLTTDSTVAQCGIADGSATVTASGGNGSFNYQWSDAASQKFATATGLSVGTYCVTVSDAIGCTADTCISVTEDGGFQVTLAVTDVSCNGLCDGMVTATPLAGNPPFNYLWSDNQTVNPATGLCAGNISVVVSDSTGCSGAANGTVTQPPAITLSHTQTNVSCFGGSNGSINLTAAGGSGGFVFVWNDAASSTTEDLANLTAGTWCVTATDINGCSDTLCATITQPGDITLTTSYTPTTCGDCNGTATVNVTGGGTPGFSYLWDAAASNQTAPTATGLCPGLHNVTVTDNKGCTKDTVVNVVDLNTPIAQVTDSTDITCFGACDGTATVTASGGYPPYTINWGANAGNQSMPQATGLCPGSYTVCVTDSVGCKACADVSLSEPSALLLTTSKSDETCAMSNGSAGVTGTGGTGTYQYIWSPGGGNTATLTGLSQGTYCVTVTDVNLCSKDTCITIVNIPAPAPILSAADVCDGQAVTFTYGSTGNIVNCTWDFGDSPPGTSTACGNVTYTYTAPGTYVATHCVDDGQGCQACATDTVTVHPLPLVCFGDSAEGCVPLTANFTNCSSPGDCLWDFGDNSASADCNPVHVYTQPGCYNVTLTITSPAGCTSNLTKDCYVEGYPWPVADFDASPWTATMFSPTVNFIDKSVNATGWLWDFGDSTVMDTTRNPVHEYKDTGCYNVRLTLINQWGCTDTIIKRICVIDEFVMYIPNAFTPNGNGVNEFFRIKGVGIDEFELYVFDRWGNLIFESTDVNRGWDGTANGGTDIVQEDVYVWMVLVRDIFGRVHRRIGHVSVIR